MGMQIDEGTTENIMRFPQKSFKKLNVHDPEILLLDICPPHNEYTNLKRYIRPSVHVMHHCLQSPVFGSTLHAHLQMNG